MYIVLIESIELLMAAVLVAIVARRLHLPYTVGLVLAGISLALAHLESGVRLTHDLIFDLFLPPLLFEAAIAIHWNDLRRDAAPVAVLSIFGVVISATVVTYGMVGLLNWPLAPALLFGVLISATDPVAVIAMFKDTGIGGRLRLLVESESLFNDGVAAVFFALALTFAQASGANDSTGAVTVGTFALALAHTAPGGVLVGLLAGGAAILVIGRTQDHLIETAVTTVTAYGAFLISEHLGASGVLATLTAGLLIGNLGILSKPGPHKFSGRGREFVVAFWEFAAFLANSMVFLLIGLTIGDTAFTTLGWEMLIMINLLVLIARLVSVYPLCAFFAGSSWRVPMREQHMLWWGGLRGALALALVLALPPSFPLRSEIIIAAFSVVSFSVLIQGLTMPIVVRLLALK